MLKVGDRAVLPNYGSPLGELSAAVTGEPGVIVSIDDTGWAMVDRGRWGQFGCHVDELTPAGDLATADGALVAPMPPREWLAKFSASSKGSGGYGWQTGWLAGYEAARASAHPPDVPDPDGRPPVTFGIKVISDHGHVWLDVFAGRTPAARGRAGQLTLRREEFDEFVRRLAPEAVVDLLGRGEPVAEG